MRVLGNHERRIIAARRRPSPQRPDPRRPSLFAELERLLSEVERATGARRALGVRNRQGDDVGALVAEVGALYADPTQLAAVLNRLATSYPKR